MCKTFYNLLLTIKCLLKLPPKYEHFYSLSLTLPLNKMEVQCVCVLLSFNSGSWVYTLTQCSLDCCLRRFVQSELVDSVNCPCCSKVKLYIYKYKYKYWLPTVFILGSRCTCKANIHETAAAWSNTSLPLSAYKQNSVAVCEWFEQKCGTHVFPSQT